MALPPHIGGDTGALYLMFGRWDSPFVRGTRPALSSLSHQERGRLIESPRALGRGPRGQKRRIASGLVVYS
jgi:hypothetical protein